MTVFVVAYDLNSPGQRYKPLINELQRIDSFWAQQSLWFVDVPQTQIQLRNVLQSYLDTNDTLWVQHVRSGDWASTNMTALAIWLQARGIA